MENDLGTVLSSEYASATAAIVYALAEDVASVALYRSAGFSVVNRSHGFTRPEPPSSG
ncbi:hypothetical protein ACMHYB_22170 [Sorangium sp. So ce1128]